MPRTLPWLKRSSPTTAQGKRPAKSAPPPAKRQRLLEPSSDVEDAVSTEFQSGESSKGLRGFEGSIMDAHITNLLCL